MEIELYRGSQSFVADLQIDPETGEIGADLDLLVFRNPIGTAAYVLHTQASVEMLDEHIKKVTSKMKALQATIDRAKASLAQAMKATCTTRIQSTDGVFKAVLYPERDVSVDVFDDKQLPNAYITTKVTVSPDKQSIKQAIYDGVDVPGARLVKKDRLSIT